MYTYGSFYFVAVNKIYTKPTTTEQCDVQAKLGLARPGLARPGLAWPGQASPGPAHALFCGGRLCIDLIDGNKIETAICAMPKPFEKLFRDNALFE